MRTLSEIKKEKKSTLNDILIAIMSFQPWSLIQILEQDRTYQDVSLLEFVELVQIELNKFKMAGDTSLFLDLDVCQSCKCDEPVIVFSGNNSSLQYALYFEYNKGKIVDIFQCHLFGDQELF